jgi:acetyl-CoA acetyltransferase
MGEVMSDAWIVDAVRTPIECDAGAVSGIRPDDLAATVIREPVARQIRSLAHEFHRQGGGWGLATICIGVGQGLAVVLNA